MCSLLCFKSLHNFTFMEQGSYVWSVCEILKYVRTAILLGDIMFNSKIINNNPYFFTFYRQLYFSHHRKHWDNVVVSASQASVKMVTNSIPLVIHGPVLMTLAEQQNASVISEKFMLFIQSSHVLRYQKTVHRWIHFLIWKNYTKH